MNDSILIYRNVNISIYNSCFCSCSDCRNGISIVANWVIDIWIV